MYDVAYVWTPKKSLMRERYGAPLGQTPRVLFGLSQSWQPLVHVIQLPWPVRSVAFSPDGSRLVSGSDKTIRIWNTTTDELEDELEGHGDVVRSVAFSHNGHFIVSGSWDDTIRIWNTATCETTHILGLGGHEAEVMSVAISRNDKFVVSGSIDRTVRMWDTETGWLLRVLKGHGDRVVSVAVSPDCQHIASVSRAGELWIWTKDGVIEHKLECPANKVMYDLAFSNDGSQILCNVNRTEWTTTGHCLSPDTNNDPGNRGCTMSAAYSPDDSEIVYGTKDGDVMIWNRDTNNTHRLGKHSLGVRSVAFSPNGSHVASGSLDGTIRIWDPRLRPGGTIDEEASLKRFNQVALSRDAGWIVTASRDIQVWSVTETVTEANGLIIEDSVSYLALSHDSSCVAIGCEDGSIQVWNHLTNEKECQMSGHSDWVTCVAFSYDGRYVVSGSRDKTVRIWDCHTGNGVALYQLSDWVTCVAFSRDGGRVAFGSRNNAFLIWNPSTGQVDMEPQPAERIQTIAFSHNDSHVIYGSWNDVWIWNPTTNESTQLQSERIQLPDGTRVHSLGSGHFHIYDPIEEEDIPQYLLSISQDRGWIIGEQAEHNCWIPPHYRDFESVYAANSIVCLRYRSGRMIVLDLKSTQGV